jgi:CelD/BcsL family acetyltransferase involved in cellulose biosynthesis
MLTLDGQAKAMCIVKPRRAFLWTSFLPSQAQIGPTLIPDAAMLAGLVHSLPYSVAQLDLLCNDPLVGGVVSNSLPQTHRQSHALTMQVQLGDSFESYWASRSKNLQSNFKRYEKRLQADGISQRIAEVSNPNQILAAVDRYAVLEGVGWKGKKSTALGSVPEQLQFYRALMHQAAEDGMAFVHELWLNDSLAASRLVVRSKKMLVVLKTTHDENLAAYAPGRVQLRAIIEDAFASYPGGTLEFYTDANVDQLAWATGSRWIQHATVFRWQWAELLITALRLLRTKDSPPDAVTNTNTDTDAKVPNEVRIEVFDQPDALPLDAQKLMSHAEQRNVELGMAWYRNLVSTVYPNCTELRFYVLRHGQQVVAVLPLRAEKARRGWQLHSLSNYYTALYEPALTPGLKPKEFAPLLTAVRLDFPGAGSIQFAPMDPASHGYQTLLTALRLKAWVPFEFFAFGNWYLTGQDKWTDYLASRNSTLRSTLKRMTKKFANDGGTLQIVNKAADLQSAIAAYEQVYAASWKKPEPYKTFTPGLLQACASQGWLRLGLAWLNGKPIAAQLWIVAHGRAEIYKVAYDESFKSYSPGTLLTAMLMEHVIEHDRVHEVDYLIGDDPYKKTWMSHRRERWGVVAYNPKSLRGLAGLVREMLGRWIKPWITRLRV